jgi:hypothetical protein
LHALLFLPLAWGGGVGWSGRPIITRRQENSVLRNVRQGYSIFLNLITETMLRGEWSPPLYNYFTLQCSSILHRPQVMFSPTMTCLIHMRFENQTQGPRVFITLDPSLRY